MTVSNEMSAARKLGTLVRTQTPRVSGTKRRPAGRGLAGASMLSKEQALESAGPGQGAGHRRGHAELDQQRDENERIGHPSYVLPSEQWTEWQGLRLEQGEAFVRSVLADRRMEGMAFESVKKIAEADFPTRWGAFRILGFEGEVAGPRLLRGGSDRQASGRIGGAGDGGHSLDAAAGADSLAMLDRGCIWVAAVRLPAATGAGAEADWRGGRGDSALRTAGRPRHWADGEAEGLRIAGPGADTVEANEELGYAADCRGYELPAEVLKLLGVKARAADDEQSRESGGAGVGGD